MKFEDINQTKDYIAFSVYENDLMEIAGSPLDAMQYFKDKFGVKVMHFGSHQLTTQPITYWRFVCEKPTGLWQGPLWVNSNDNPPKHQLIVRIAASSGH